MPKAIFLTTKSAKAIFCQAKRSKAMQSNAKQCKAKQSKAKQSKDKHKKLYKTKRTYLIGVAPGSFISFLGPGTHPNGFLAPVGPPTPDSQPKSLDFSRFRDLGSFFVYFCHELERPNMLLDDDRPVDGSGNAVG